MAIRGGLMVPGAASFSALKRKARAVAWFICQKTLNFWRDINPCFGA